MRPWFLIGLFALLCLSCSPVKKSTTTSVAVTKDSNDSSEYELVIIDPQFDQWYLLNYSPSKDHFNEYYREKDLIAVSNWNDYYRSGQYGWVINSLIEYHASVDYGIEVNRKLFWYFKYIKSNYRIPLF